MSSRLDKLLPLTRLIANPIQTLLHSGIVVIVGLLLGMVLPGLVYWRLDVFTAEQVVKHLPTGAASKYADHEKRMRDLNDDILAIDHQIDAEVQNHSYNTAKLFADRASLLQVGDYEVVHAPIVVEGYFLDTLMYVWPLFYIGIGWLLVIFPPSSKNFFTQFERACLLGGTYLIYRFPTWVRNLPLLRSTDRRIFSYGNIDVSRGSFYVQEVQAALACVLLVMLWMRWVTFIKIWRTELNQLVSERKFTELSEFFGSLYVYWQICSVVLAIAFIPYTIYFWNAVIDYGEKRYLLHALIMHAFWGLSWLLISIPVAWTWYVCSIDLSGQRSEESKVTGASGDRNPSDGGLPIGNLNVFASLVSTALTFAFPLIKEFLK